jgi:sulfoxide reductase heme-binding subunit YedZ
MTATRQSWFEGWRLFAVLTAALTALCVGIAGMRGFEVDGVRMVIRFTARTSLLFFCLAFSAAALARLCPNAWTRWQRRNRRYLGVTFAASHGLHAIAIVGFAVMDPAGYAAATSAASYIFGGIGYAFIIAMTATSFERTAQALGPRAWRALHLTGGYYLLFQFMVSQQADSRHAALCAVPDPAGGGVRAAHGQHGRHGRAAAGAGGIAGITPPGGDETCGRAGGAP